MACLAFWNRLYSVKGFPQRCSLSRLAKLPEIKSTAWNQLRAPISKPLREVHTLQTGTLRRPFHTSLPRMASVIPELKRTLSPAVLGEVRNFWFGHLSGDASLILPSQSDLKRWFTRDESFDNACVAQFRPALEAIEAADASATDILDAVDTSKPLNWLSILLLLDQVSRNCYRGEESKVVFGRFDPLAEDVAMRALGAGIPTQSSDIRYRVAYRFWFLLPLMHSENLAVHEEAVRQHEHIASDIENFLSNNVAALNEDGRRYHSILSSQRDVVKGLLSNILDFEKRHKVIIERFGRYPHRNEPLGRTSTTEEVEYLENGGETFG